MIRFILGVMAGIAIVIYQPEIMTWFIDSGMRDDIVGKLNGV